MAWNLSQFIYKTRQASFFRLSRSWLETKLLYIWLIYHRIDLILLNIHALQSVGYEELVGRFGQPETGEHFE